jgi:hypothetical protein
MPDVRWLYKQLNKPLNEINTVASFADASPKTLVTVNTPSLAFFTLSYFIFDSPSYPNTYQGEWVASNQLNILTAFNGNDAGVNIYDVTEVYMYYLQALDYITSLPCADPDNPNFDAALSWYALYLYTSSSPQNIKRVKTEGEFETEYFDSGLSSKNQYYENANQLLNGCLEASKLKPTVPTLVTSKTWCN